MLEWIQEDNRPQGGLALRIGKEIHPALAKLGMDFLFAENYFTGPSI